MSNCRDCIKGKICTMEHSDYGYCKEFNDGSKKKETFKGKWFISLEIVRRGTDRKIYTCWKILSPFFPSEFANNIINTLVEEEIIPADDYYCHIVCLTKLD